MRVDGFHHFGLNSECRGLKEAIPVRATKLYGQSRSITPLILNLETGWRGMIIFTLRPLYSREGTLEKTLDGSQSGLDFEE
jgi:hypothetical protein